MFHTTTISFNSTTSRIRLQIPFVYNSVCLTTRSSFDCFSIRFDSTPAFLRLVSPSFWLGISFDYKKNSWFHILYFSIIGMAWYYEVSWGRMVMTRHFRNETNCFHFIDSYAEFHSLVAHCSNDGVTDSTVKREWQWNQKWWKNSPAKRNDNDNDDDNMMITMMLKLARESDRGTVPLYGVV